MEQGFVRINIAFKPSVEAAREAERLSLEISRKEEAFFVLDSFNFYPHITIYPSEYPAKNLERLLEDMDALSKNFSPLKFITRRAENHHGYVTVAAKHTQELGAIHRSIVEKINPLRGDHLREKYVRATDGEISQEKKRNIRQYGYPDLMDLYVPHLTITRLKDEYIAEQVAKDLRWETEEFVLDTIGVYSMGGSGTCVGLIKEFKL